MVIYIIIIIIAVLLGLIILLFNKVNRSIKAISLKESLDLTGLPIVTFKNNGKNFNFLLDTGSNDSYIDSSVLKGLEYKKIGISNIVVGATGSTEASSVSLSLSYKDIEFENTFFCFDLSKPFSEIKHESGIQIHGILGTKFFEKYKYILNFDKLALYIK